MESRSNWLDLIQGVGLEIAEVFNQAQTEFQPGIFNVLNRITMTGAQRNVTGKTGIGEIAKFLDGDDLPGGRRYKTYTTQTAPNNYGKFVDVTKLTIEDRGAQWEADLGEMRDLSIAANYSQDRSGMQLLNGGFSTTVTVNGYDMTWYNDTKALFSTAHPTVVPGGSTQSNASSTSLPFSHDNLETGLLALDDQKTDDGLAMNMVGVPKLILPNDLRKEGLEITQSEQVPNSANNAINVYKNGMNVDMISSKFLTSTFGGSVTAWFLIVPGVHKLNHVVRQEPRLEQDVNIKNKMVTFTVDARWADSAEEYKGTWGSKGDNSTYSG